MCHAISAIDVKHVPIKSPKKSGLLFYNYKGFYSTILLSLDVGQNGSSSDVQIFNQCELTEAIKNRTIGFAQMIHFIKMRHRCPSLFLVMMHLL